MNKPEILNIIKQKLSEKIESLEKMIAETRASNNETKSSMGDKYETSREMVQQEINNLQIQLNENLKAQNSLKFINVNAHQIIGLGTLVQTEKGFFYIAVSLGEIIFDGEKIFLISAESPLAKAFLGKKINDAFNLNGLMQKIKNVW